NLRRHRSDGAAVVSGAQVDGDEARLASKSRFDGLFQPVAVGLDVAVVGQPQLVLRWPPMAPGRNPAGANGNSVPWADAADVRKAGFLAGISAADQHCRQLGEVEHLPRPV